MVDATDMWHHRDRRLERDRNAFLITVTIACLRSQKKNFFFFSHAHVIPYKKGLYLKATTQGKAFWYGLDSPREWQFIGLFLEHA